MKKVVYLNWPRRVNLASRPVGRQVLLILPAYAMGIIVEGGVYRETIPVKLVGSFFAETSPAAAQTAKVSDGGAIN